MPLEITEINDDRPLPIGVPLSRYWAMDEGYFATTLSAIMSLSPADAASMAERGNAKMMADAEDARSSDRKPYRLIDGIAYMDLVGPMTKRPNCMAELFGGGGASTMRLRQTLRAAVADKDVKSIIMMVESPGGEVNGAFDLAADVAKANKIKPITAYIEDIGASAAYLVASQAGAIYANSNAVSGSIGVYQEVHDTSKMAAFRGVKVHVVKAGERKGIGVPGTEVTDEQLAVVQENANKLHGLFLRAVSTGRGMDAKALARVADGSVFIGADGKRAGLIDGVLTLDQVHSEVLSNKKRTRAKGKTMAGTREEEVQAQLDAAAADEMPELEEDVVVAAAPPAQQAQEPSTPAQQAVVPAPTPALDAALAAAVTASGITSAAQLQTIMEMSKVGEDYKAALAKQVIGLAVVAFGPTDAPAMSVGVDKADITTLKALNRQFAGIAQAKGLIAPNGARLERQTESQDIAGGIGAQANGGTETNEGHIKTPKETVVAETRANMVGTGLYSL